MRILLQRVSRAEVRIRPSTASGVARVSGRIRSGYVALVGFTYTDTVSEVRWMADKIIGLRVFPDAKDRLNRDLTQHGGAILVVSQFTLYADMRKGKRPSFLQAAPAALAIPLYDSFVRQLRDGGVDVQCGEFGAMMDVELVNDGPVTLWLEREAAQHLPST